MKPSDALARVQEIDLSSILWKLKNPLHGNGMCDVELKEGLLFYQQFLALQLAYPEETIVPTELVDKFWHAHILDTSKYAEDCEALFGKFLHHFPYAGWQGGKAEEEHQAAFTRTKELFETHFRGIAGVAMLCPKGYCDPDINQLRPSYIPA